MRPSWLAFATQVEQFGRLQSRANVVSSATCSAAIGASKCGPLLASLRPGSWIISRVSNQGEASSEYRSVQGRDIMPIGKERFFQLLAMRSPVASAGLRFCSSHATTRSLLVPAFPISSYECWDGFSPISTPGFPDGFFGFGILSVVFGL